jgi:DNA-binding NarL/FixJ family response regulator
MSIRLMIADDHEIVRTGLGNLVAGTDIEIVGSTGDGEEAVRLAATCQPDVVLLDVRLGHVDGLTVLSRLKQDRPTLPVLLFSGYDNPTYVARSVALGASGYLLKEANRDEIMDAIRAVAAGRDAWTREGLRRVTGALATPRLNSDIEVPLTQRESDVLKQMALGLTNKEIAAALHISYETVKEHVQHILRKLGVSDRTQAAVWAVRKGIV